MLLRFERGSTMKKAFVILLCVLLAISVSGCAKKSPVKKTIPGNMKTYIQMDDGTWMCEDHIYKYRLEICGRMPNAAKDSCFVYLSNIEEITFDQAFMAAGVSSDLDDYFPVEEAVLVEMY
jgi:hypothetical protein